MSNEGSIEGLSDDVIRNSLGKKPDDRTSEACFAAIIVVVEEDGLEKNAMPIEEATRSESYMTGEKMMLRGDCISEKERACQSE
jgi:hypothetical protein